MRSDDGAELFSLDPAVAHLNHGSFGAVPIPVQRAQQRLRDEMDANPMAFFSRGLGRPARPARGASPHSSVPTRRCTALIANATAATRSCCGSLDLAPATRSC